MYDNTLVTSVELCDNVKFISDGYEVMLRCADRDIYIDRQKAKKIAAWLVRVYGPQLFNAQAHQTPERSVGGMVPPVVGNSGSEETR